MWRFWPNCRGRDNYQVNKIGCGGKHTLDRFRRSTDEGCVGLACAVRPDPIGIEEKSGEASLLSRQGHAHVGRVGSDDGATLSAGVVAERVGRYTTPLWVVSHRYDARYWAARRWCTPTHAEHRQMISNPREGVLTRSHTLMGRMVIAGPDQSRDGSPLVVNEFVEHVLGLRVEARITLPLKSSISLCVSQVLEYRGSRRCLLSGVIRRTYAHSEFYRP